MPVKIKCPLCGGKVLLYGEQHDHDGTGVDKGYFCVHCDYKFFVDKDGNVETPPKGIRCIIPVKSWHFDSRESIMYAIIR